MDTAFQQQLVALADDPAAQGAGLSTVTWAPAPTAYVGDWPTVLAHRVPPPPPPASIPPAEVADVLVQERHRRQQYLHELAAYLCWSRIHDDADGSP